MPRQPKVAPLLLTGLGLLVATAAGARAQEGRAAPVASGQLLIAQFAAAHADRDVALDAYDRALQTTPEQPELRRRTFEAAVLADRTGQALPLARTVPDSPVASLVIADEDIRHGDWHAAQARFAALPQEGPLQALRPLLIAWAQWGGGDADGALATLHSSNASARFPGVYALHAALICDQAGRTAEAARFYSAAAAGYPSLNLRLGLLLASWQAREAQMAEARGTLRALLQANPDLAIAESALSQTIASVQIASAQQGIAEAYFAQAATPSKDDPVLAPLLLRLSEDMRPGFTTAKLMAAELAAGSGAMAQAAALLASVPPDDPLSALAELRRGQYLGRAGQPDEATALLQRLAARLPQRPEPVGALAQLQRRAGRFAEAAATYGTAIDRIRQPGPTDWALYYEQGIAFDQAHNWPAAEQSLLHALDLAPNQPMVLNYLGYAWTEQGRNLVQAQQMIERAVEQQPNDGSIVDSLGWALLRQGKGAEAVRYLERAAELEPEDATINGHLGDAYMAAGRPLEAQIQWRWALILNPDQQERQRIDSRIAAATSPATPQARPAD